MGVGFIANMVAIIVKSAVNSKVGSELGKELIGTSIDGVSEKGITEINNFINGRKSKIEHILSEENMEKIYVAEENVDFVIAESKHLLSKVEITDELIRVCRYNPEDLKDFLWSEYRRNKNIIENESDIEKGLDAVAKTLIELVRESEEFEKNLLIQISNTVDDANIEIKKISDYLHKHYGSMNEEIQMIKEQLHREAEKATESNVITIGSDITPTNHFVGRKKELECVCAKMQQNDRVLLSGMGGIGKTEILKQMYNKILKENRGNENILLGYFNYELSIEETIYSALKFEKTGDREIDVSKAKMKLEEYSNSKETYIFIDNVPTNKEEELHYLDSVSGKIVISSRQTEYENYEAVPIDRLSLQECINIFKNESSSFSEDLNLQYIIDNLIGRHTLTVKLLARVAKRKEWSIEELKNELVTVGFKINYTEFGKRTNILSEYKKLYSISGLYEYEKNILESFSILREVKLDKNECKEYIGCDVDEYDIEILYGLYEKGWIERSNMKYSIHPVFAEFIAESNEIDISKHKKLFEYIKSLVENLNDLEIRKKRMYLTKIISFAKYIHFTWKENETEKVMISIAKIAYFYTEYDNAIFIAERIDKNNKENYISAQLLLSEIYLDKNDFKQVEKRLNNIFDILKSFKNDLLYVDYKINYALYLEKSSKNDRDRKVAIDELLGIEGLDMDDDKKGKLYNCLGGFYTNLEKNSENLNMALDYHKKALLIREKYSENKVIDLAMTYNNIANVHFYKYRLKQEKSKNDSDLLNAKEFYEKSLYLRKKIYNKNHPKIARVYVNIGNVYLEQGNCKKALKFMFDGLNIRLETIGETTKEVAITYSNIMNVYVKLNDKEHALEYGKKSEKIYEKLYGKRSEQYDEIRKMHINLIDKI